MFQDRVSTGIFKRLLVKIFTVARLDEQFQIKLIEWMEWIMVLLSIMLFFCNSGDRSQGLSHGVMAISCGLSRMTAGT